MHMTTLGSSVTAPESSMDNATSSKSLKRHQGFLTDSGQEGDSEVWASFDKSFRQVQSVLDRNRALIKQVDENHQSRIPDNMAKNVALIQELNGNISKVVSMYSDLSSNFSTVFHQRSDNKGGDAKSTSGES